VAYIYSNSSNLQLNFHTWSFFKHFLITAIAKTLDPTVCTAYTRYFLFVQSQISIRKACQTL